VTWPIPTRFENSVEFSAKSTPFSNCRYPTGVSVAGVDTVGRPGLASGSDGVPDCAGLSRAKALNMHSKQIVTIFNLSPLKKTTQIYFRIKCGTYQRVYVAIPSNSTTHQSTRTLRIHTLYSVIRNFPGKTLVPADNKMYNPASSVTVPSAPCVIANA